MSRAVVAKWIRDILPHRCANCGDTKALQYHHIVPLSCGGNEIPSNVVCLCGSCHSKIHFGDKNVILHNDLIRKGIAEAKERGVHFGKPCADYERIMRIAAENSTQFNPLSMMTEHEVAEMAGVGYTCYCKCKRMLKEAMRQDKWPFEWERPKTCAKHAENENRLKKVRAGAYE